MGAYLSQPVTDKVSSNGASNRLLFGDSSMQGWRVSQEDAHNSLPEFDTDCSLFAVYDGHGGHEVAAYTARTLPDVIRNNVLYKQGEIRDGLRQAFLDFDKSLTEPTVIEQLKQIAGEVEKVDSDDDEDEDADREVDELFQEASMPLDQLMAKYTASGADPPVNTHLIKLKKRDKPLSPFLRGKPTFSGSSSSASGSEDSETSAGDSSGQTSEGTGSSGSDVQTDLSKELMEEVTTNTVPDGGGEGSRESAGEGTEDTQTATQNGTGDGDIVAAEDSADGDKPDAKTAATSETSEKREVNSEVKVVPGEKGGSADVQGQVDTAGSVKDTDTVLDSVSNSPVKKKPVVKCDSADAGDATPVVNGSGKRGGKGARPGSGKSPAPVQQIQKSPPKKRRQLPGRAAAEIYRRVLADSVMAPEHQPDAEQQDVEDEEESDDDYQVEQSNGVEEDDDNDDDDDDDDDGADAEDAGADGEEDGEEEAEEEEEDEDDEDEDALGDEEEEEESDFVLNMKDEPGSDSGCTAVVALLRGRELYVANIGDSRCVLSRSGRAVDMSADHKPEDEPERERILKAGGKVTMDGRVNGGLNLSRAFGDHAYKVTPDLPADQQMISASPDIRCVTIDPDTDEFLVLACDGIWNSKTSQQVVDFVSERIRDQAEKQLSKICEDLFDECLAPNTMGDGTGCDNMTCIIVKLKSLAVGSGKRSAPEADPEPSSFSDTNQEPEAKRAREEK